MEAIVNSGRLLPDALILRVLREHFMRAHSEGTDKFLLDGFPRTVPQAQALEEVASVQLALNLGLREEVLVEKCLGRRICKKCGKNYNVADIYLAAREGHPEIIMPPLNPPPECVDHMEQRSDDTEPIIRKRLEVSLEHTETLHTICERVPWLACGGSQAHSLCTFWLPGVQGHGNACGGLLPDRKSVV